MSNKNILFLIISIFIIVIFTGCGQKNNQDKTAQYSEFKPINNSLLTTVNLDESSAINVNKEEKIEIARELFDEYINQNRTDWKMVEFQKLDRKPVVCLTDYRINDIDFVKEEGDKFIVDIGYDIQYTNESNFWVAGNGELSENNWVKNKCNFVDIKKYGDKYVITNIYTG